MKKEARENSFKWLISNQNYVHHSSHKSIHIVKFYRPEETKSIFAGWCRQKKSSTEHGKPGEERSYMKWIKITCSKILCDSFKMQTFEESTPTPPCTWKKRARTLEKWKKCEHSKFCLIVNHKLQNVKNRILQWVETRPHQTEWIYILKISLQRCLHSKLNSLFLKSCTMVSASYHKIFHPPIPFVPFSPSLCSILLLFSFNLVTLPKPNSFNIF